jgi:hypothetical protein
VLVEGLVGGGAPLEEDVGIVERLRPPVGVVVLDLVVVPGDQRGRLGVEPLEIGIELVLSVPVAIGGQRGCLDVVAVPPDRGSGPLHVLVDVVAEEDHDVRGLVREVPVGREVAVLVVGAGDETEPEPAEGLAGRRRRPRAADAALGLAAREAIPVGPAGLESAHLQVDRVGVGRLGDGLARLDDSPHAVIRGDVVAEDDVAGGQPPGRGRVGPERLRGEPRPQDEPVRPRLARGHSETERIPPRETREPGGRAARKPGREDPGREPAEEAPASERVTAADWSERPVGHRPMIDPNPEPRNTRISRWLHAPDRLVARDIVVGLSPNVPSPIRGDAPDGCAMPASGALTKAADTASTHVCRSTD